MSKKADLFALPGRQLFSDLLEPVLVPGAKPGGERYSIKLQVSKETPEWVGLWDMIERVAYETWGTNAEQYLQQFDQAIGTGMAARYSPISIEDGDLIDPQHNAGFWMLQATRKAKLGPPELRALDGAPCATDDDVPQDGDGVIVMFNVWAQPQYERMNFSLIAVRRVIVGERVGGGPSKEEVLAGVEALAQMQVPRTIPGVKAATALPARAGAPRVQPQTAAVGARPSARPVSRVVTVDEPTSQTEAMSAPVSARPRRGLVTLD